MSDQEEPVVCCEKCHYEESDETGDFKTCLDKTCSCHAKPDVIGEMLVPDAGTHDGAKLNTMWHKINELVVALNKLLK